MLVAVGSADVREGLVAILGAAESFRVVGEAASDEQAIQMARTLRPGLAIIDEDLPSCGGAWTILRLRDERLVRAIVAIGLRADGGALSRAQTAGAQVFVQTGASPDDVLSAVRAAISPRPDHAGSYQPAAIFYPA